MRYVKTGIFLAYLFMIIRSFIYGMSMYFTGSLLDSTNVFDVLALRFLLSAVVFSIFVLFRIVKVNYKGKKLMPLVLCMIFEPIGYFIFETYGIAGTTTSVAGILVSLAPAFTVILETIILRETTTPAQKFLIFLRILGGLVIICNATSSGSNTVSGVIFMLLSVISGVLFTIFSRKASKDFTAIEITYAMTLMGALVFNTISVIRHIADNTLNTYFDPFMNAENIIGFVFLGILSSIIATIFNNYALGKVQASTAAAIAGLASVVTVAAGVILNGEQLYWYHYVSIALIIIASFGVGFIDEKKKTKNKSAVLTSNEGGL